MLCLSTATFASFPVNKKTEHAVDKKNQNASTTITKSTEVKVESATKSKIKSVMSPVNGDDDDKIITILLWFFLGAFAAHRWYVGKPVGWNILFILTIGGCGVWAIIDLIKIITDKF